MLREGRRVIAVRVLFLFFLMVVMLHELYRVCLTFFMC